MTLERGLIDSTIMGSMFEVKSWTHQNIIDVLFL